MRTLTALPISRPPVVAWRLPLLFTLMALASLGCAVATLVLHERSEIRDPLGLPAAAILSITAFAQARLAWLKWQTRTRRVAPRFVPGDFARKLFVGIVLCYLAALAAGPGPGVPSFFAAGAMAWLTALLLPLTANVDAIEYWRKIHTGRGPRRFGRAVYLGLLLSVCGEFVLQAGHWLWGPAILKPFRQDMAPARQSVAGMLNFPTASAAAPAVSEGPRKMRVAIVGGETTLTATGPRFAIPQLESALPSCEVVNLGLPPAGPSEHAGLCVRQARQSRADLVLTFVSVADDIVAAPAGPSLFDWHWLCTPRVAQDWMGWPAIQMAADLPRRPADAHVSADDWEAYVAACGPQLTPCRKPIQTAMQLRWKNTLRNFDDLAERCRRANLPLALVIVPSPLQTNRPLLEAVCRRQGCCPADVDLELPQRRLAAYAADRMLPMLDLLPAMRLCPEQPYVHHGWRWSHIGNEVAAHALSGWLQSTFGTRPVAACRPDPAHPWASDKGPCLIARQQ